MRRLLVLIAPLAFVLVGILFFSLEDGSPVIVRKDAIVIQDAIAEPGLESATTNTTPSEPIGPLDAFDAFDDWLTEYQADRPGGPETIVEGLQLAKARLAIVVELIKANPELALSRSMGYQDYADLPTSIKPFVEEPFSDLVDLSVYPGCELPAICPGAQSRSFAALSNGTRLELFFEGERRQIQSKKKLSIQGVHVEGVAAINRHPVTLLADEDIEITKSLYPLILRSSDAGKPHYALFGGTLLSFSSRQEVTEMNQRLKEFERLKGPYSGYDQVYAQLSVSSNADLGEIAASLAGIWTETTKTLFFIIVDFPDLPGEPVSQAALADMLNFDVSTMLQDFSYNKTAIHATVSSQVIRMPHDASFYADNPDSNAGTDDLRNEAQQQFELLNTGTDLDSYDLVGIYFADIGMPYSGIASIGGWWLLIQDLLSPSVFVHELGHNYGLYHAKFWDTGGTSVTGPGTNVEYGDPFDVMGSGTVSAGHYGPRSKTWLNWIPEEDWVDASQQGSDTYRLYRIDHADANANRAIRIDKDVGEYYWIGYRQNYPDNRTLADGLYITWDKTIEGTWLIDTTPGSVEGKYDSSVVLGRTFSDYVAGVHITPVAKGGTSPNEWIDVSVNIGEFSGNQDPVGSVIGDTLISARVRSEFTASFADPDGDDLVYHWDFGDGQVRETTSTVQHRWIAGGIYDVTVTASDLKGGQATSQMQVTVEDPLQQVTGANSGTTANLRAVASNGMEVLAIGNGVVTRSQDGVTWQVDSMHLGVNVYPEDITAHGNQWIAVGSDYDLDLSAWVGTILTSVDGSAWQQRYFTGPRLRSVACDSVGCVATGEAGTILSSTDGVVWNIEASGTTINLTAAANGNGTYVAVGAPSSGGPVVVLTSINGMDWADRSDGAGKLSSHEGLWYVAFLYSKFVGSGWNSPLKYSNTNGFTFESTRLDYELTPALAYGGGVYFAAGVQSQNGSWVDIELVSVNGEVWFDSVITPVDDQEDAVFFNQRFITVGDNGSIYYRDPIIVDGDADGIADGADNCLLTINPQQVDTDSDGAGNACDHDDDGDGVNDDVDVFPLNALEHADADGDGTGDNADSDDDNDGMPDDYEIATGLNPLDASDANADADADGFSNLEEYLAGSDPQDAADPGVVASAVAEGDLNGDLTTDILMRNTATHRWFVYLMDGRMIVSKGSITATRNASWQMIAKKDINGDGKADILLRNSTNGKWYAYLMNGRTVLEKGPIMAATGASWQIVAITDLNGDGKADIMLRNRSTGKWFGYLLDGRTITTQGPIAANALLGWEVVQISDQNGDNKADILLRNSVTHRWISYLLDGLAVIDNGPVAMSTNRDWKVVAAVDLNADGKADMLMRNIVSGRWYSYLLDGRTVLQKGSIKATSNQDWEIVSISDLNADNKADILLRNASSKRWFGYLLDGINLPTKGAISASRDPFWELVSAQDLDGDGTTDILGRNRNTGKWYGYLMNGLIAHEKGTIGATVDSTWLVVQP